jgi:hypothetical protein
MRVGNGNQRLALRSVLNYTLSHEGLAS